MARKQVVAPKIILALYELKDEAAKKIQDRVSKGSTLKEIQIVNAGTLESAQREVDKWDDFNDELLKRLFTSKDLSDEYSGWCGEMTMEFSEPTLQEKASKLYSHIDEKNHRLDSILDRLELIPEISSASKETKSRSKPASNIDKSKIFVVHGHDDTTKLEIARFIEKMGFEAIILHEQGRARQNVVFENGFLIGKLGRDKIC